MILHAREGLQGLLSPGCPLTLIMSIFYIQLTFLVLSPWLPGRKTKKSKTRDYKKQEIYTLGILEAVWKHLDSCCLSFSPVLSSHHSYKISHSFETVRLLSHVWHFAPNGLLHTRLPCPSSTPGVYSNSCPLSWWCHPTISSSVVPFSSCLQSFPTSGPFPMSQFFASGGQNIRVSVSISVLPMNIQDWSALGWTG